MRKYFTRSNMWTALGVVVSLYLLITLGGVVKKNHDFQTQLNELQAQIDKLESEKQELSYQIQYYQTDSFKEKEARAKLGLANPGESVVILPRADKSNEDQEQAAVEQRPKSNIAQWFDFLFGS